MSSPRWAEFLPCRSWQSRKSKSGTHCRDLPGGPVVKNPPCNSGVQVQSLSQRTKIPMCQNYWSCNNYTVPVPRQKIPHGATICLLQLRPNNSQINIYIWCYLNTHTHTHTQGTDWRVPVCPATPTAPGQIHDHLEPQNGILFATGVLADVIKHLQMESSRLKVRPKSTVLPWGLRWSRIRLRCRRPGFDPWVGKIP